MKELKAVRQRATGTNPRKPLPSGKSVFHSAKHIWTPTETNFLLAYLQWSVDIQVDFDSVAVPRFINATNSGLKDRQVVRRLNYVWECNAHSRVAWKEFLKIGLGALRLSDDTLEQVGRIRGSILGLDTEPCSAAGALQGASEMQTQEEDAITIRSTAEHVQQIEVADNKGQSDEQSTSAYDLTCEQSAQPQGDQKQAPADIPTSNKRKILDLESQLFVSQNETAYFKRRLKELPTCSPEAAALDTLKGYFGTNTRFSSREKTFDVNNPGMPQSSIADAHAALFEQIQSTCSNIVESDDGMPDSGADFPQLAQLWARQTFKKDIKKSLQDDFGKVYHKEELLVGLMAAALIERVFEPTFPSILQNSWLTSNPYREVILQSHGPDALHLADSVALPLLISNQKSGIIDRKVEELHKVLSKSLQPFWDSRGCHSSRGIMDGNDIDRVEMPAQGPDLRQFLHSAVELKYKLTSSTTRLKFLYFQPQDPFDEKRMVRCKGSNPDGWRIIACLFPVLLYPPPRPANMTSNEYLLEYNVDFNMYFTELTGNPLGLDVAAKAIVLT
ncbi:hypothetical protein ACHAP5_003844 [Fusarium lateritium]